MSIQLQSVLYPVTNVETALIADEKVPIIVPFGPACSGKTMMLNRLFRYLCAQGEIVQGNRSFAPTNLSSVYDKCIDTFFVRMYDVNLRVANFSVSMIPLLFDVIDRRGKQVCYILEQLGTSYFDENDIKYPVCLGEIVQSPNKKIWVFLLDSFMRNELILDYVKRIIDVQKTMISNRDKVIFVATKVDTQPFGSPLRIKAAFLEMRHQYNELFDAFKNTNPITSFFRPYNFDFVAFSAGEFYYHTEDRRMEFYAGRDEYPRMLWKSILKCI